MSQVGPGGRIIAQPVTGIVARPSVRGLRDDDPSPPVSDRSSHRPGKVDSTDDQKHPKKLTLKVGNTPD